LTKRFPPMRYPLPEIADPAGVRCFMVPVPDDEAHINAFKDTIYRLAWSKNWARDETNTAADVARVWQEIYDNLEECDNGMVQFRQEDDCGLEASFDGGETWEIIFNAQPCSFTTILDAIEDGVIEGGSGVGNWPVFYDFTGSNARNWYLNGGSDWLECGNLVSSGWETEQDCATLTDALGIRVDFLFPVHLTSITVHYFCPNNINGGLREVNRLNSTTISTLSNTGGEFTTVITLDETLEGLIILLSNDGGDVGRSYIYDVTLNGTGLAPSP